MVHGEYDDAENALCGRTLRRLCGRTPRRLQVLHTEDIHMERILRRVEQPNLLGLTWKKYPHTSLPSWLPMKNLRILRVSGSVLTTLWHRKGESQALLQLPVYLKELWTDESVQLKNISGVERLTQLRQLVISGCSQLEELPSMDSLVSLEELWADRCVKLKSIMGLGQITKVRYLIVSGCFELEELQTMGTMVSLENLVANECVKLKRIQGIENLVANECVKLKSIQGMEQCTKLRKLYLSGCAQLEKLPKYGNIDILGDVHCRQMREAEEYRGLGKLQSLDSYVLLGALS